MRKCQLVSVNEQKQISRVLVDLFLDAPLDQFLSHAELAWDIEFVFAEFQETWTTATLELGCDCILLLLALK